MPPTRHPIQGPSTPWHPSYLCHVHPNIKIVFLPLNTISSCPTQQVADSQQAVMAAAQAVAGCENITAEEMREMQEEDEFTQIAMLRVDQEDHH